MTLKERYEVRVLGQNDSTSLARRRQLSVDPTITPRERDDRADGAHTVAPP